MGLINETNSEYYSGEQIFLYNPVASVTTIDANFDVELFDLATNNPPTLSNYEIFTAPQTVAPFVFSLVEDYPRRRLRRIVTLPWR